MAISIKLKRSNSTEVGNVFLITAGSGDTGQLQIQYNGSDIYNNLSGLTPDILSGATNTDVYIPLSPTTNEIEKGVYYFNFVASVGDSDTEYIDFQVDSIDPVISPDIDVYAPSYIAMDDTNYTVDNATVSAASRTMTVIYPSGSSQSNLTTSQSDVTTSMYISTSNVWTGAMQAQTTYDITYTIASTILGATTFASFVYQELGTGYNSEVVEPDNLLSDLYACIESLRKQVVNAESTRRSDYEVLLSKYQYVGALATQFREGVVSGNTASLEDILAKIKNLTNCSGASATNPSSPSIKVYGINGAPQDTFTLTTAGSSGAATFVGNVLNIPQYSGGAGSVTEVTTTAPLQVASGTTTPALSVLEANSAQSGVITTTDWNTFNNKQDLKPISVASSLAIDAKPEDIDKCIYLSNTGSVTYTLVAGLDALCEIGDEIMVVAAGSATTVASDSAVTLNGVTTNSGITLTQYKPTLIKKVAAANYFMG